MARKNAVFWAIRHHGCQERIISICLPYLDHFARPLLFRAQGTILRYHDTVLFFKLRSDYYSYLGTHRPGLRPVYMALLRYPSGYDRNYQIGSLTRRILFEGP